MPASKLAQKASGLLKGLRSKQSLRRNGKSRGNHAGEEVVPETVPDRDLRASLPQTRSRQHATAAGTTATLGKRRRYSTRAMSQNAIAIHEDAPEATTRVRRTRRMSAITPRVGNIFDQDSDSTDGDEEVDDTVLEDMRKLEENFAGISQKYRLVNRIGEGDLNPHVRFGR
jgi:hypothetical protein